MSDVPCNLLLKAALLSVLAVQAAAWGSSSNSESKSNYGNGISRDWLYDGSTISMKLEGCMWGYVEDSEESGCMQRSSEDGTTYWYQMANCRRAQAVYSLYTGGTCSSSTFAESFATLNGLSEFIYYLSKYDNNNAFANYYNGDDDGSGANYNGGYDELPLCEQYNGNYIGLGCSDDGSFSLQYYSDQHCLQPTGTTYDNLRKLNRALKSYKSCTKISSSSNNNNQGSLASMLVVTSESCSSLDSSLCTDNTAMKTRRSHTSASYTNHRLPGTAALTGKSWITKLKYVAAGLLLLASFVMFTGILFTNRRRRRALMQRKYRQSKSRKSRSRSVRSKSKTRSSSRADGSGSRSRRSKSRTRQKEGEEDEGGIFT